MMQLKSLIGAGLGTFLLASAASAAPLTLDFKYPAGPYSGTYGTMEVSVLDSDSLQVKFTAKDPSNGSPGIDFQVTGFVFDFNPENGGLTVSNPANGAFAGDRDDLNWIKLTNLNPIPNPANSGTVTKNDFEFGVTEGNANNFNPPGIKVGDYDIFYLNGFAGLTADTDLSALIDNIGIRIQSLPSNVNGGSLLLVGTPSTPPTTDVPEPTTLALFGAGLLGLGLARRARRR